MHFSSSRNSLTMVPTSLAKWNDIHGIMTSLLVLIKIILCPLNMIQGHIYKQLCWMNCNSIKNCCIKALAHLPPIPKLQYSMQTYPQWRTLVYTQHDHDQCIFWVLSDSIIINYYNSVCTGTDNRLYNSSVRATINY